MQKTNGKTSDQIRDRMDMASLATESISMLLRDALCDTDLRTYQKELQRLKIPKKLLDPEILHSLLRERSYVYGRMSKVCETKKDNFMARIYRSLEEATLLASMQNGSGEKPSVKHQDDASKIKNNTVITNKEQAFPTKEHSSPK